MYDGIVLKGCLVNGKKAIKKAGAILHRLQKCESF
jgi:hypothetical protein